MADATEDRTDGRADGRSDGPTGGRGDERGPAGPATVYCRDCGAEIRPDAEICPDCGVRQLAPRTALDDALEGRNPFVAAVASMVLPGLGQLYNRQLWKGLAVVAAFSLSMVSMLVLVGFLLVPAVWLYAVYDAYVVARKRAEAAPPRAAAR